MSVSHALSMIRLSDQELTCAIRLLDSFADVGFMLAGRPGRIVCAIAYWLCEYRLIIWKSE